MIDNKLANQIKDACDLNDVLADFNNAIVKSDMIRKLVTNELIDDTLSKMSERLNKYGDEFSHKDLTDYLKALTGVQNKQSQDSTTTNIKNSINLTQVNVSSNDDVPFAFDRESRARIADVISQLVSSNTSDVKNLNIAEDEEDSSE